LLFQIITAIYLPSHIFGMALGHHIVELFNPKRDAME
jgi:hypothetical protein